MFQQCLLNTLVKLPFTSTGLATGLVTFANVRYLLNGVTYTPPGGQTYTEIGNGVYTINFTPTSSGFLQIFIEGSFQQRIEVVSKTINTVLQNLEDEALGSWTWNKNTGLLTLLKQDTTTLATFNVVDNTTTASRERVS